jgi:antibiotic biosynthesis monooxygenase (ABM) superfamily enzyme
LRVEVRVCRASAVIVQRVPAAVADWFLEWQRGVSGAAEAFAGYRATDVYPVTDGRADEWVVVVHFEDDKSLQQWLASDVRARWVEKLRAKVGDFTLKTLPGGFGFWFAGLARGPEEVPPSWKVALTVLLALYPTAMLLTLFVGPYTAPLGPALAMLVGNALSVPILQWGVMPVLTRLLAPWLKANTDKQRGFSIAGLVLILFLLVGLAALFRLVS